MKIQWGPTDKSPHALTLFLDTEGSENAVCKQRFFFIAKYLPVGNSCNYTNGLFATTNLPEPQVIYPFSQSYLLFPRLVFCEDYGIGKKNAEVRSSTKLSCLE